MFKTIEHPTDCEIHSVICLLNTRNVKLADIHRQIYEVYGETAMSDGMVRKWVTEFNKGRDNVRDELRSSWPSVVSDDLVGTVKAKVHEDKQFTISSMSMQFQQISRTVLYETVTDHLDFRKLCSRWVPKMLSEEHKTKWAASVL